MIRIKQAAHIHVYSTAPSSHPLPVVHSTAYCTSHPICQMSILKYEKFVCKKPSLLGSRGCESWCDCDVVVVLHIYVSVSVVWSSEWCILSVWASPLSLYGFCLVGGNMDQVPGLEQYGCGGEGRPGRHTPQLVNTLPPSIHHGQYLLHSFSVVLLPASILSRQAEAGCSC